MDASQKGSRGKSGAKRFGTASEGLMYISACKRTWNGGSIDNTGVLPLPCKSKYRIPAASA